MNRRLLLAIIGGLGLLAASVSAFLYGNDTAEHVPTMIVSKDNFVQRVTAEGNLEAVKSTPLTAPVVAGKPHKIAWLITDGARVEKGDVIITFDPTDFEKDLDNGIDDQRMVDHRLKKAEIEAQAEIKNLDRDAQLSREEARNAREFKSTDTLVYSRNEIIESEIDTKLAEQRATHAEDIKEIQSELSQADIDLLELDRRRTQITIEQAEAGLESLQIQAPHDGIVIFERDWRGNTPRVGETVWAGRALASIPELDHMQAVVYVLEADAGGLAPGQAAIVTLEAHPGSRYDAEVESVDPIAQRRVRGVPVQYFRTVLSLAETDKKLMKPGQRVQAEIFIAEESAAIAVPRQAVLSRDGASIVYRRDGDSFEAVEVTVGPSARGRVVIRDGLEEGDEIALSDPQSDSTDPDREESTPAIGSFS